MISFLVKFALFTCATLPLTAWGSSIDSVNPFAKNYFTFEVVKNSPLIHTQDSFQGKYATYAFGFRHNINEKWFAGISINFRSLERLDTSNELSFLSLNQESLYIIRLYHPAYLFIGGKLLYLLPTERSKFPVLRESDYETEVGAAASLAVAQFLTERILATARIDRWRGTKTNRFHGTEVGFGLMVNF